MRRVNAMRFGRAVVPDVRRMRTMSSGDRGSRTAPSTPSRASTSSTHAGVIANCRLTATQPRSASVSTRSAPARRSACDAAPSLASKDAVATLSCSQGEEQQPVGVDRPTLDCDHAPSGKPEVAERRGEFADLAAEPRVRDRPSVLDQRQRLRPICGMGCDVVGGARHACQGRGRVGCCRHRSRHIPALEAGSGIEPLYGDLQSPA
jgi:hypothetical protein